MTIVFIVKGSLNKSSGKLAVWDGGKAEAAGIALAIAMVYNAADRPNSKMHVARGLVQRNLKEPLNKSLVAP